jgi:signal transduction histidine kinase
LTQSVRLRAPLSGPVRAMLLTIAFSIAITLPVLLFVYNQTDRLLENRIANRIDDRERNLMLGYRTGGRGGLIKAIDDEVSTGIVRGGAILLVDRSGTKLAGNIAAWPPNLRGPTRRTEMRLYSETQDRAELFALRVIDLPSGERLLFGTNLEDREQMRAALAEALVGAMLVAIPLGLLFGFLVVRVTERRARAIGRVAERLAAGDFSQRLDENAEGAAFSRLACAINAMLERIEELVEQLRIVTDSLAHDLRSPLTRIRANIEKIAKNPCDDDQQHGLEAVSDDVDRMMRIISATLEIGRTEAGMGRQQFDTFDLHDLLRDICEIYHPAAEELGISLDVEEPRSMEYFGNRQLIGRAVANLVDNALKYAGKGGEIRVSAREDGDFIRLSVADRGPGIAAELRGDAVAKYRRLEESRTTEGSGLGLALVRSVARLHGGDVELLDNRPGLRVVMSLRRNVDNLAFL